MVIRIVWSLVVLALVLRLEVLQAPPDVTDGCVVKCYVSATAAT